MDDLVLFLGTIFNCFTSLFNLYTTTLVLSFVLAIWLLRKVVQVFRHIR